MMARSPAAKWSVQSCHLSMHLGAFAGPFHCTERIRSKESHKAPHHRKRGRAELADGAGPGCTCKWVVRCCARRVRETSAYLLARLADGDQKVKEESCHIYIFLACTDRFAG